MSATYWVYVNMGSGGSSYNQVTQTQTLYYTVQGPSAGGSSFFMGSSASTLTGTPVGPLPSNFDYNSSGTTYYSNGTERSVQVGFNNGSGTNQYAGVWAVASNDTPYDLNFGVVQIVDSLEYTSTSTIALVGTMVTTKSSQGPMIDNALDGTTIWYSNNSGPYTVSAGTTSPIPPAINNNKGTYSVIPAATDNPYISLPRLASNLKPGDGNTYNGLTQSWDYRADLSDYLVMYATGGVPIGIARLQWAVGSTGTWNSTTNKFDVTAVAVRGHSLA